MLMGDREETTTLGEISSPPDVVAKSRPIMKGRVV